MARLRPKPAQAPCTLAITGLRIRRRVKIAGCSWWMNSSNRRRRASASCFWNRPWKCFRSPPAMKWSPAPAMTRQRTAGSRSISAKNCFMPSTISSDSAFSAAGRSSVNVPMGPSIDVR